MARASDSAPAIGEERARVHELATELAELRLRELGVQVDVAAVVVVADVEGDPFLFGVGGSGRERRARASVGNMVCLSGCPTNTAGGNRGVTFRVRVRRCRFRTCSRSAPSWHSCSACIHPTNRRTTASRPDDTGALPCPGDRPYETFYPDDDGDGYGRTEEPLEACQPTPSGYALRPDDCDDTNADVHPDQKEDCATDFDDDCDGTINQPTGVNLANCTDYFVDTDADGFGNARRQRSACATRTRRTRRRRRATATTATPRSTWGRRPAWRSSRRSGRRGSTAQGRRPIGDYVFAANLDAVAGGRGVLGDPTRTAAPARCSSCPGAPDGSDPARRSERDPHRRHEGRAARDPLSSGRHRLVGMGGAGRGRGRAAASSSSTRRRSSPTGSRPARDHHGRRRPARSSADRRRRRARRAARGRARTAARKARARCS